MSATTRWAVIQARKTARRDCADLVECPQVLIVDEPTTGFDPEKRVRFCSLPSDLAGERIVILTTQIVSDAEATAARVAVMNHGRLLKRATPEMLLQARVGQILAATPIRKSVYVLGKWLSSLILVAILNSVMAWIGLIRHWCAAKTCKLIHSRWQAISG